MMLSFFGLYSQALGGNMEDNPMGNGYKGFAKDQFSANKKTLFEPDYPIITIEVEGAGYYFQFKAEPEATVSDIEQALKRALVVAGYIVNLIEEE
jgi:hypothetical protein